jgi:hypothetical protein
MAPRMVFPLYSCGFQRHTIYGTTAIFHTIFNPTVRARVLLLSRGNSGYIGREKVTFSRWFSTDPDAAYFSKDDRDSKLGYFDNHLMDSVSCVIIGVEATVASSSQEIISARTMLADCAQKFGLTPKTLAADSGYGEADFRRT